MDIDVSEAQLDNAENQINRLYSSLEDLNSTVKDAFSDSSLFSGIASPVVANSVATPKMMDDAAKMSTNVETIKTILSTLGDHLFDRVEVTSGDPVPFWDSWFGSKNKAAGDFFKSLYKAFFKQDKYKDKDYAKNANDRLESHNRDQKGQDLFTGKKGYNEDYKVGDKFKFGTLNFVNLKKKISGELAVWAGDPSDMDKQLAWGTGGYAIRAGSLDHDRQLQVGPDHIVVSAGVEVAGIRAQGKYDTPALRLGGDDGLEVLSAGVEGDVSLIYGEAKGKLAAGYWKGEDGKWHRELGVQLKGELDLFKAEAKGHVTVAGVKAEGSAAVKFGIGAELNAGFVDGKFNFKLGVAAGLGFELGFSLDFGSLGSTVKSGAKKLWSGVKSLFSGSSKDASVYGGS